MSGRFTVGVVCTRGIGPERGGREENEDNYLVCREGQARYRSGPREQIDPTEGSGLMVAVADGMGGHAHGDLASEAAVQALARFYSKGREVDPEGALHAFVLQAHRRLHNRLAEHGPVNSGTTLTVAWMLGDRAYWVHVGDSRIYHHRDGVLTLLTRDHTRREFAARDGREYLGEKNFLVQSFVFGSRGLGHDEDLRIDAGTDTGAFDLAVGDRIVLVTDGVSGVVPDHRIGDAILEAPEPAACATWLAERAMAAGTDDNITAVVVRVDRLGRFRADSRTYDLWDDPLAATDDGGSDGGGQTG